LVGVLVGVFVGVLVDVLVGEAVGVLVADPVGVAEGEGDAVDVALGAGLNSDRS
jgi:hypothetical protein